MSVLEQVAAVRESRRKAAQARVAELAHLAVEGQQVDATEVADTLDAAGLADGWFAERVAHIERRKGQLAMVAHQADYEQQRTTAEATMKEAGAKLEVAQRDYNAVYGPAWNEFQAAGQQLGAIATARQELRRTTKAPAIVGRANEITAELEAAREREKFLTARQGFLTREIARLEPQAENHEEMKARRRPANYPDPATSYTPGNYDAKEHDRVQQSLDNYRAELTTVETELASLPVAVAALEAERESLLVKAEQSPL